MTAAATTATAPRTYDQRHDVAAATSPRVVTPTSRPRAHDVSMIPTTRLRRS